MHVLHLKAVRIVSFIVKVIVLCDLEAGLWPSWERDAASSVECCLAYTKQYYSLVLVLSVKMCYVWIPIISARLRTNCCACFRFDEYAQRFITPRNSSNLTVYYQITIYLLWYLQSLLSNSCINCTFADAERKQKTLFVRKWYVTIHIMYDYVGVWPWRTIL